MEVVLKLSISGNSYIDESILLIVHSRHQEVSAKERKRNRYRGMRPTLCQLGFAPRQL